MSGIEHEIKKDIYLFTASGFFDKEDIFEEISDLYYDHQISHQIINSFIEEAFKNKLQEEKSYPHFTDCDRLKKVFDILYLDHQILAMHLAGLNDYEGEEDVFDWYFEEKENDKTPIGYCFYNQQDIDDLIEKKSNTLQLAFGDFTFVKELELNKNKDLSINIGIKIIEILKTQNFETRWDGNYYSKIEVLNFNWQNRLEN